MSQPSLSIVVPVRNEAENVGALIGEIMTVVLPHFDAEVLFINDGSSDGTAAALAECAALYPALRVYTHGQSCGQSAAIMTGVRRATKEWIAVLDGDGQNDPADIHALWPWVSQESGPAMAIGHRTDRQDDKSRKSASQFANTLRQWVLGDGCPDSGCGLKMLPRSLFLSLPYFDHMHRFMPALVLRAGGKVASIPVKHRPRTAGVSNYSNWKRGLVGIVDLGGVLWLKRRSRLPRILEDI